MSASNIFVSGPNATFEINYTNGTANTTAAQAPLMAAQGQGPGGAGLLTDALLAPIVTEAIQHWADAGVLADQLAGLVKVHITVADLSDGVLASTSSGQITIDDDAAGWGWFVDATPADNIEFSTAHSATELAASSGDAAAHMDLLTAVTHELGHVLGLEHTDAPEHLMDETVDIGIRRLPDATDAAHAAGATAPAKAAAPNGTSSLTAGGAGDNKPPSVEHDGALLGAGAGTPVSTRAAAANGASVTAGGPGNDTHSAEHDGVIGLGGAGAPASAAHITAQGDLFDFSALLSQLAATPYRAGDIGSNGDETFGALQTDSGADQQGGQHWADLPVPGGIKAEDTMDAGHFPYITAQIVAHQPDWLV